MKVKQKVFDLAVKSLKYIISMAGDKQATLISAMLSEKMVPIVSQNTEHGDLLFYCYGRIPEQRARTLLTKEPETIEWIDSFHKGDVLWDIGANVGVYSLYAALKGVKVMAFEPSPANYFLLSKNIEINQLDNRISSLCLAFNDETKVDVFFMENTELGGALSSFAEAVDWQGKEFSAKLRQSMVGFSIDDFIKQFNPMFPNHIKIDVDGIEDKIIVGARETLKDDRIKTVLIELDASRKEYCGGIIKIMENSGLKLVKKLHSEMIEDSIFSSVYNHIFVRQ